jgi:hypothetical protein
MSRCACTGWRGLRRLLVLALGLAALPVWPQAADEPAATTVRPLSAAEQMVFLGDHLKNTRRPTVLRYNFGKAGSLEAAERDEFRLTLREREAGGCCIAEGAFQGEHRQLPLPEIDSPMANPVILYFLEHDVRDMQRRTQGQSAYFRRRIRMSLADQATVVPVTIRYGGRELPAREVRVAPYLQDPMRSRYERYAAKQYVIVLADDVPGGVYQLRTLLPAEPGKPALIEETLTLAEPADAAASPERSPR